MALTTRHAAEALAGRLPPLLVAAERVAATVSQGVHGRRRAGSGDSFWQFRPYSPGDTTSGIDWRQTGKSGRAYIRENEWEAAQSVYLWADRSPSMRWQSSRAVPEKSERAALLLLALASMLLRGGERIALLGGDRPTHGASILDRMASALTGSSAHSVNLPDSISVRPHSTIVLIGDFLSPLAEIAERLNNFAAQRARIHLLQVLDPAEETLPFVGRIRFDGLEGETGSVIGKVENIRQAYQDRLAAQRAGLNDLAARHGWTFATHRTDHSPHTALLTLYTVMADALQGSRL